VLRVNGAGATATALAEVEAGRTIEVDVRTTDGGTLVVEVVDALGRPLPYATLTVVQQAGLPWIDLDGDAQRIDPYTDVHGKRTLRRVEANLVKVKAAFGSRSAEADVQVGEGETARVRLVLRHAEPPPPEPPAAPAEGVAER
jgi:hypothetical protein